MWASNAYITGIRPGIGRAHSIKREPDAEAWGPEFLNEVRGTPWKPHPGRYVHKILTGIDDEVDEQEEDEREVVIDIHEEIPGVDIDTAPLSNSRVFSITMDDAAKCGATDKRRGCKSTKRNWKRPFAHLDRCRSRIMEMVLEADDEDGRAAAATKKAMQKADAEEVHMDEVLNAELSPSTNDAKNQKRHGKGHIKTREEIQRERRSQALMEKRMAKDLHELAWNQCHESMTRNDLISVRLERSSQGSAKDSTVPQKELNKEMLMSPRQNDVSEICSPPRVVKFAKEFDLAEGWSLDLATCDSEGREWGFYKEVMREKARELVRKGQPTLVT